MNCVVGLWIQHELDDEDRARLSYVLEEEHRSMASLYRIIMPLYNFPFSLTAFKDHVKGRCSCGETG
ncbi:hypothetical protein HOT82_gp119 [Gordonia phage Ronaldo]|uniref:Uncharacterized protein n=4 Tax=Ronaldovirus TaxID=2733205 RepID=A0A6B9LGL8_9CAUD|nr:hypothetical protein HOT81_gp118 [Gordonia phage Fryberger]YP_009807815.1 hypothetical protein HOT82_gp119 [Gordonia phage Ronaldo]QDH48458.1 hypothetical protein SEA_ZIKO_120 [Gordonia phage Ziko]QHB38235.1 hypothetical protein SEA_VOLT_122 [Gordonia phage Volt]QTF81905.1 hypothetical protein SEA_GUEY18_122 [Gordonia phage Guey18]AXN53533.1 hypothetical protein SEA_FRYBERGER_118 [Gordonia phage Fryberger]AXN53681.1 hypothetical protein SEA_RONALDO_119 [Gordonia phage Ronaldo]